jgi:hypothetical protein
LRDILPPPKELSLPYSNNKERKSTLISRVCNLYPNLLDGEKVFYKIFLGLYDDKVLKKIWSKTESRGKLVDTNSYEHGKGILQYPFAI